MDGPWAAYQAAPKPWEMFGGQPAKPEEAPQSLLAGTAMSIPAGTINTVASVPRGLGALTYSLLPQATPETTDLGQRIFAAQGNEEALRAIAREVPAKVDVVQTPLIADAIRRARAGELKAPPTLAQGGGPISDMGGIRTGQLLEQFANEKFPVSKENQARILPMIASAVGSSLAMMPAAAFGPLALVMETGISGMGQSQSQAEQGGASSAAQAQAALEGAAPGLLDAIPLEQLFRPLAHLPLPARSAIARRFRTALEQSMLEAGTEGVQQFLQNVIAWQIYNPKQSLSEGVIDSMIGAGGAGFLIGGAVGSPHHTTGADERKAAANEPLPTRIVPQPAAPVPTTGGVATGIPVPAPAETNVSQPATPPVEDAQSIPQPNPANESAVPPATPTEPTEPVPAPTPEPAQETPPPPAAPQEAPIAPPQTIAQPVIQAPEVAPKIGQTIPEDIITTPSAYARAAVIGELNAVQLHGQASPVLDFLAKRTLAGKAQEAVGEIIAANPKLEEKAFLTALGTSSPESLGKTFASVVYLPANSTFSSPDMVRGVTSSQAVQRLANETRQEFQAYKLDAKAPKVQFGNLLYTTGSALTQQTAEEGLTGYNKQAFDLIRETTRKQPAATIPKWFKDNLSGTAQIGMPFRDTGHAADIYAESLKSPIDGQGNTVSIEELARGKAYISGLSEMKAGEVASAIHALVQDFVTRFAAQSSVLVRIGGDAPNGVTSPYAQRMTDDVYLIHLPNNFLAKPREQIYHAIAHEFSHVIHFIHYANAPASVKRALQDSYNKWLHTVLRIDPKNFDAYLGGFGEFRFGSLITDMQGYLDRLALGNPKALDYHFGFKEWFANQGSIYLQKDFLSQTDHPPAVKSFFEGLAEKLREFFNGAYKRIRPPAGIDAMMQWSAATSQVYRLGNSFKPFEKGMPASLEELPDSPMASLQEEQLSAPMAQMAMPPTQAGELARFTKLQELGYSLLQIGKRYPTLQGLQDYIQLAQKFWSKKMEVTERATEVVDAWNKLGKGQGQALSKFLYDVTLESLEKKRRLTSAELATLGAKNKLTADGFKVFEQIDTSFKGVLAELEAALTENAKRTFTQPLLLSTELERIKAEFTKLNNQHYFPLTRFGKYYIKMQATENVSWGGKNHKAGDTMLFETFENEAARNARLKALKERMGGSPVELQGSYMPESGFAMQGFPPSLLDSMKTQLALFPHQLAELEKLMQNLAPGQSFKQHMLSRRGVAGFTQDAMRAYASYMMSASGHIARLTFRDQMFQAAKDTGAVVAQGAGQDVPKKLEEYLNDHWKYLNNPGEEWASVKSGLFTVFLGLNVKSAFVNLTQIPMVAMPYFASRYGDVKAATAVTKAMADVVRSVKKGGGSISPAEQAALDQGVKDGFLNESFASDLAGAAQGSTLDRMLPLVGFAQVTRKLGFLSSFMFQKAEEFNRRATFLAAYRLSGGDYAASRDAVQTAMFEYNRWAKPKIMRGRKSVLFAFMQYTQHMLWFLGNDKGAGRLWLAMALAAGAQGLPFADDLIDLLEGASGMLSRLFGYKNPLVDIRKDMRDLFTEAGANPDLMMHGLGRYSMGLALFGSGMPAFDLSGSLGMGQLIPGVQPIAQAMKTGVTDVNQLISQMATDVGGAGPAVVSRLLQAAVSNNPDQIQRWQGALPTFAQSFARAYQYSQGAAVNNLGDKLVQFDMSRPQDVTEVIGQALGFRPTRVATTQEKIAAQRDAAQYYSAQKQILLGQYFYARKNADREGLADVNSAIARYNKAVPFPELRLTFRDRAQSYRSRLVSQRKRELGMGAARQDIRLYKSYNPGFPSPP